MWFFQFKFSSMRTPKNFVTFSLSTSVLSIVNIGRLLGSSLFLDAG